MTIKNSSRSELRILPVDNRRARRTFVRLPASIYASDRCWVQPLLIDREQHFSPANPYFAHADWRAWIALRGRAPVGRISAQIDHLHIDRYRDATGFFGMIEARDDPEVFTGLLERAETWLRQSGMRRVLGPFNLSINEESGLLVSGFDTPPMVMMGHAKPYYQPRIESLGYTKEKDLLAYSVASDFTPPPTMRRLVEKDARRLRIRPLNRSRAREEFLLIRDIFNDAWSENWGFIPFTEAEFLHIAKTLVHLVPSEFVQIAEVDGQPAGMIVLLPNVNEAIRDLNGRLLPFGWFKLLWRLKVRCPTTARVALMGVRRQHQATMLGSAIAFLLMEALRAPGLARGIQSVEMSWILENNKPMRRILEAVGARVYKRYRIFGKTLSDDGAVA